MQANRMLTDPAIVGGMDTEAYLSLLKAAGYSEETAQKAASDWAFRRLEKGLPM